MPSCLFSARKRKVLFTGFALICTGAALFHLAALYYPLNKLAAWRNSLFVLINLFAALAAVIRPRHLIYVVVIFFIQQCYVHGSLIMQLWHQQKQVHWISVMELALFPLALLLLAEDNRMKTHKS
jgi:hypothetical protein